MIGRNHPSTVRNLGSPTNMEWKDTMQGRAEGTNWQRGKRPKIGIHSFASSFASQALGFHVNLMDFRSGSR